MPTTRNLVVAFLMTLPIVAQSAELKRYLYVAQPGIRNYTQYGGHGVIVYDINKDYSFVRRIPFSGLKDNGKPDNVKGICGNAATGRESMAHSRIVCVPPPLPPVTATRPGSTSDRLQRKSRARMEFQVCNPMMLCNRNSAWAL